MYLGVHLFKNGRNFMKMDDGSVDSEILFTVLKKHFSKSVRKSEGGILDF